MFFTHFELGYVTSYNILMRAMMIQFLSENVPSTVKMTKEKNETLTHCANQASE